MKGLRMTCVRWIRLTELLLLFVLLMPASISRASLENEAQSLPAPPATPSIELYTDWRIAPVVEDVARPLRSAGMLNVNLHSSSSLLAFKKVEKDAAHADVLIVQSWSVMELAIKAGLVNRQDVITLASDRLIMAVRTSEKITMNPLDLLKNSKPGQLSICDPSSCLAGLHAENALKRIGLWKKTGERAKRYPSVVLAIQAVERGDSDGAIVYRSDIAGHETLKQGMSFPKNAYLPILYFAAPIAQSKDKTSTISFIRKLVGKDSGEIWMKHGFSPPPEGMP